MHPGILDSPMAAPRALNLISRVSVLLSERLSELLSYAETKYPQLQAEGGEVYLAQGCRGFSPSSAGSKASLGYMAEVKTSLNYTESPCLQKENPRKQKSNNHNKSPAVLLALLN